MATIEARKNKKGEVTSYTIRVYKGYDINGKRNKSSSISWKPPQGMSQKKIEKELNRIAVEFENSCKAGYVLDSKQTFAQYAEYVLKLKESSGTKYSTINYYRYLLNRINPGIGHLRITDIRPQHLNQLYVQLAQDGLRTVAGKAVSKVDLRAMLAERSLTFQKFAEQAGVSINTFAKAVHGEPVEERIAVAVANALEMNVKDMFDITYDSKPLSNKTILEHHRFISTVFAQAEKEMLVQYNPASKATPPKAETKEANYFEIEDIEKIRDCLEHESIKWRTAVHLLLITGARRGEILGLKWKEVDWKNNQIHICNNLIYSKNKGVYEGTPKTALSRRYIKLPQETMELLKEYREWYDEQRRSSGDKWVDTDFLFVQDNGKPMHPTSLTSYCNNFSKKYDLPHINPHAFRHTMVSVLYFNGMDSISISRRLGHSKVSTTTDKYGHIMQKADEMAADCIAEAVLRRKS